MAQSKKEHLKRLRRQFVLVGRMLETASCDILILDFYKHIDVDLRETVQQFKGGYVADLRTIPSPVTCQHLDQLQRRVTALQRRLDPGCYDYDPLYAGML